ncbi:hypothetical protein [Hyphomicrobium sp.]|jgi:uncharacterized membrane protein|uniref:hypothetical protein n=1 Tax=Hyphomicrobium sp. TaxID=82 RepID=UPI002C3CF5B1|nr:hypothetical protein [Hyphomicrobium sp.]HVZ05124.1 hypothetical protein [Hyphomicrobium sp.]
MSFFRRFDWRLLLIFLIVAAIVHIIATFLAVNDRRGSAYMRLLKLLPPNTMTIADPIAPHHELLPYLAPDARYAFCPFDTADKAMRVHALLPEIGWTIGVYAPDGTNLYFAAASAERETTVNLAIVPADDRFLGLSAEARQSSDPDQTIAAPKGFIVVRAPDRGDAYRAETRSILEKASCVSGHA